MKGCTAGEFIDDLLSMGGPEKEFVFRSKLYFLETMYREEQNLLELYVDEYDGIDPNNNHLLIHHSFWGRTFAECTEKFEKANIFDGMDFYSAENEIEVLYG
ncbi:MAG: hypothetical protein K5981_06275 [Clostridia bacterium]|nr:hypothetical protein [Clostridia bacterium]